MTAPVVVQAGREVASSALQYLLDSHDSAPSRLGFLHNPWGGSGGPASALQRAWEASLKLPSRRGKIAGYLDQLLQRGGAGVRSEATCPLVASECTDWCRCSIHMEHREQGIVSQGMAARERLPQAPSGISFVLDQDD